VKLIGADPEKGFIDFEGPASDVGRKIARPRQKKAGGGATCPAVSASVRGGWSRRRPQGDVGCGC